MSIPVYIANFASLAADGVLGELMELNAAGFAAVALLYTPAKCVVACVTEAGFAGKDGAVDPEGAYEIIVFCADWEFRWVRDGDSGHGRLISETAPSGANEAPPTPDAYDTNDISYLVWGKNPRETNGGDWVTLSAVQIGKLDLPVGDGGEADRYALTAREYFVREETHGNVGVGLQRLVGIQPWKAEATKGAYHG